MNTNIILELKDISKRYKDGEKDRIILDKVNLAVHAGEFVAIVGPSGAGKSTLLSIAGMLLSVDSGSVIIGDKDYTHANKRTWTKVRRNHIGFIFQSHQLLPYLCAKDQLSEFQSSSDIDGISLLKELGLADDINKYPNEMSGGQKQRVAIARAFINNPEIILADEPTASLDAENGRHVVELMSQEVKKYNKAAIMVTHDERVLDLVDKVYELKDKKILLKKN